MNQPVNTAPQLIRLANHIFDLEKKIAGRDDSNTLQRIADRMKNQLAELGLQYHDPSGEAYEMTRTDCEASISGDAQGKLIITDVIKPIVWQTENGIRIIVQKAVVIVESKK